MDEELKDGETTPEGEPSAPEQTVPLKRFQEVYAKQKNLEQEIATLKEQKKEGGITPEQEKELQAKQYLKNLLKETLSEQEQEMTKAEQQELEKFSTDVDELIMVNPDVKLDDFLKFMEEKADDYGVQSVKGGMKLYRDLHKLSEESLEKAKEILKKKPSLPTSEGLSVAEPHPDDKGKSITQIAQEIARSFKK